MYVVRGQITDSPAIIESVYEDMCNYLVVRPVIIYVRKLPTSDLGEHSACKDTDEPIWQPYKGTICCIPRYACQHYHQRSAM